MDGEPPDTVSADVGRVCRHSMGPVIDELLKKSDAIRSLAAKKVAVTAAKGLSAFGYVLAATLFCTRCSQS